MPDGPVPPGWSFNPSGWLERLPAAIVALAGCAIATYLALYQLNVFPHVWEPFFGAGSTVILKQSSIAHLLPIPDALLGAFAYLCEFILDLVGGRQRWRTMPGVVLLLGLMTLALGLTAVALVICQPTLFHAWCTLCLGSAACSLILVVLVRHEVLAAVQHVRQAHAQGQPFWRTLWGMG